MRLSLEFFRQTFLKSGAKKNMNQDELQQVMLTNSLNLMYLFMSTITSIAFFLKGENNRLIPTVLFCFILVGIYFLTKKGFIKLSKFLISILGALFITAVSILRKLNLLETQGSISALEYVIAPFFVIGALAFPLLLFHHRKEKGLLFITFTITAFQAIFSNIILKIWGIDIESVPVIHEFTYMIYFAPFISVALMSGGFLFFKERTHNADKFLKEKNESLLTTEEELRQNLEELRTTQERLEEQEKGLQNIFDAMPQAVMITDLETGDTQKANKIAEKYFAHKEQSLVGQKSIDLYKNSDDHLKVRELLKEDGTVDGFETIAVTNQGVEIPMLLFLRLIQNNGTNSILATLMDITNIKSMQREIEENNAKLQTKNEEMMTVQEELRQNMEETQSQRDFIEKANQVTEARNKKISRHTQILMNLSNNKHILGGDYLRSVEVVISSIAKALEVDIVSAWEFEKSDHKEVINLNNILSFDAYNFKVSEGITEILPKENNFMSRLNELGSLSITKNEEDPTKTGLIKKRFKDNDTAEMVLLPTYYGQGQSGVVIIERKNIAGWAEEDLSFIKSMLDVLSLAKNNEREVLRKKRLDENNEWLLRLNKSRFISNGNWEKFLEEVTRACTRRLNVELCSIWKYEYIDERELLKCTKVFNRENNAFETMPIISSDQFPEYFQAISEETMLAVKDAHRDPSTYELSNIWDVHEIASIIQMPILTNGKLAGLITCMKKYDQKKWSEEDMSLVKGLSSLITVAFQTTRQANQSKQLQLKNKELEEVKLSLQDNYKVLEQAQTELKEKAHLLYHEHENTLKSIQYAETIQRSILPTDNERLTIFPESFVLYRAKDIVSGDFYWMSEHDGKKLIGVIDCTGHGVPGGFVSLVGHNILKEIIYQKGITDPAQILPLLHQGVVETLNQEGGVNDDGMDLGLCLLEPNEEGTQLTFAGSKNTIYYTHDQQLHDLRGDKWSIGGRKREKYKDSKFNNHIIQLQKGEMLFLATDGYQDQNNSKRKKLTSTKLKELFLMNAPKNPMIQMEILNNELTKHQGNEAQRDDITVIGVRI